jgi:O-antigen/teichoic acid export membrane protein
MTSRSFKTNAVFNLAGGGLMLIYTLLLPGILSRAMTTESFGAYILGLQFIPFLMLLVTPIQQPLAPRFARLNVEGKESKRVNLVRTSIRLFGAASLIAIIVSIAASRLLPVMLGWSAEFTVVASSSITALGIAAALSFPVLVVTSIAAGQQNFLWDNLLKCSGPYAGLALASIWMLVSTNRGVMSTPQHIAYLFAAATVITSLLIGVLGIRFIPIKVSIFGEIEPGSIYTLIGAAIGVLWWHLCALLTVSVAPFIVSSIEPSKVAAFAVSASLMNVVSGATSALSGPFSVKMGQLANSDVEGRTHIFLRLQRPFHAFLVGSTCILLVLPVSLFEIWVGGELAPQIKVLILPLALANLVRQLTGPYTIALLGLGLQNKLWLSPAVEAVGAILFGAILGKYFGAIGVAYGVLIAATLRLIFTAAYDFPMTRSALQLTLLDVLFPYSLYIFKSKK